MPVTSNIGSLAQFEKQLGFRAGFLDKKGFGDPLKMYISGLDRKDLSIAGDVLAGYMEKSNEIAQERKLRRLRMRPYAMTGKPMARAQPTKHELQYAMLMARHDLLAENSGISASGKDFIKDHCPCA